MARKQRKPVEPEVQSAQDLDMEEESLDSECEAQIPALNQPIFKVTEVPLLQLKTLFKALQNIDNLFGKTQQLTIDLKTPSNRKFKAIAQKLQSSLIKGTNNGNISDKYTTIASKGSKRAAKKGHIASLSKVK